jgi:hypothetical protein
MKKKLFSKLLMGAVLLASMSSFVSCKDYDDDIQNLQEQINKRALLDDVSALQKQLASVSGTAQSALTTAEEALTLGKNAATAEALAAVKSTADKAAQDVVIAIQKADDAAAAAAKAQSTADQGVSDAAAAAKAAADAAQAAKAAKTTADKAVEDAAAAAAVAAAAKDAASKAATKEELQAALTRIGKLETEIATANGLADRVKALEEQIKSLPTTASTTVTYVEAVVAEDGTITEKSVTSSVEEAVARAHARANAYQSATNALWSAVTNVSLYVAGGHEIHGNRPVSFLNTIEKASVKFPLNAEVADSQIVFTKDKKVTYVDTIVIRVSPTSVQLKSEMISLINSQGVEIDTALIKAEVFPYDEVLTRAGSSNGLWKVALKLKDNYTKEQFNSVSEHNGKSILFAVAVNNTLESEEAEGRRVISEYDLYLNEGSIVHAYNFEVDEQNVNQIHNRYWNAEDNTATYNAGDPKKNVEELVWLDGTNNPKNVTEDMLYEENGTLKNSAYDYANDRQNASGNWIDNRQGRPTFVAQEGVPFTINFRNMLNTATEDFTNKPIRAFYVTLDEDFAVESAPSEINAWRSYDYENVGHKDWKGRIIPAHLFEGNVGQITIKEINGARGDIIGFRVYAVNYDGTLVDPDGRAFYVLVGTVTDEVELPSEIAVTVHQNAGDTASIAVPEGFFSAEANLLSAAEWTKDNPYVAWAGRFHKPVAETTADYILRGNGTAEPNQLAYSTTSMFTVKFFDGEVDNNGNQVWNNTPTEKTVRVQVTLNQAMSMLDDEVYSIMFKNQRFNAAANSREDLQKVIVKIKKVLPTTLPEELTIKKGQEGQIKPLCVYMKPVTPAVASTYGNTYLPAAPVQKNGVTYTDGDGNTWGIGSWNLANKGAVKYGVDIKPFDYADIFNNLQTPLSPIVDKANYKFEIVESDLRGEDEYVSTFAKYGMMDLAMNRNDIAAVLPATFTTPYAYRDRLDTNYKKVIVHYTYPNLSLVEENQLPKSYDVEVKEDYSDKFRVQYQCALRYDRFAKTAKANFPEVIAATAAQKAAADALKAANDEKTAADKGTDAAAKTAAQAKVDAAKAAKDAADQVLKDANTAYDNLFTVNYEDNTKDIPLTAIYYDGAAKATRGNGTTAVDINAFNGLTALTYAKNAELPLNGYLSEFVTTWNILNVKEVVLDNDDYFSASLVGSSIRLKKTRSTENPSLTDNVNFNLLITLEDVFGHEHVIKQQITMKKPVLKARGL